MEETKPWTIKDSNKLYQIARWGDGYFTINSKGNLTIMPHKRQKKLCIDITDVIEEMKNQGIGFPAVLRFHDILRDEIINLNKSFRSIIKKAKYNGKYMGVYPIKVNQMREVVEEVVDVGEHFDYGLEAGSRPELLAALSLNTNKNALTLLNGFKDLDYLKLGLLGRKINRKVIIIVEKFSELLETLELAEQMDVEPMIGLRAKLSTEGTGRWSKSSGERGKFGLTLPELLEAAALLKKRKKTHYAKLLHFHIGSQISDIKTIKDAITEGARIYAGLVKLGLPLEYFDVGGGLGIDYDGSKSTADSSVNYTLKDYIEDIIYILKQICDLEEIPHPHIVSESGRAVSARHSFVVFKVFDNIKTVYTDFDTKELPNEHILVSNMRELWDELNVKNFQEVYNDARQVKNECVNAFKLGVITLVEKAQIETLYWKICQEISKLIKEAPFVPEELKFLDETLAEQYLGNLSIFQSVPDFWAINQLFPLVPLSRLDEKPKVLATIADVTCDSDGKIDKFIGPRTPHKTLPLHEIKDGKDYYVGIFLTGAYQDVMGDMHNLFGTLNEVHLFADKNEDNNFYIEEIIPGDSADDVLNIMQYNPSAMAAQMKKLINNLVQRKVLRPKEGVGLSDFYEKCLKTYTYLNK